MEMKILGGKTGVYPGMAGGSSNDGFGHKREAGRIVGRKGEAHCYHVVTRTFSAGILFSDTECQALIDLLHSMSRFTGVEVLTYCVMPDHLHLLVRVPDRDEWLSTRLGDDAEKGLLKHLSTFYSKAFIDSLKDQLQLDHSRNRADLAQKRIQTFIDRLCDLGAFMKEFKTRFTKWFNNRHKRRGTVWLERYKSVLVEDQTRASGEPTALTLIGLYINLNPVRAKMTDDPAAYPWCGYAAALVGAGMERKGLLQLSGLRSWVKAEAMLRACLAGNQEGSARWAWRELLLGRVRYFTDGAVLGSRDFVKTYRSRDENDQRRVPKIRGLDKAATIYCMRDLRL
jgi:putative transposase